MCGIVAVRDKKPIQRDLLLDAVKTMNHRGPDNQSCWLSNDRNVGLGHARLSIIDLDTGDQPISNPETGNSITVNGELYGYKAYRDTLIGKGRKFYTNSDSEVVLALYEEYGLSFVDKLRGEYAFVIWDAQKERMVAVRDRFGIKPLYYYQDSRRLIVASEMKAILKMGVAASIDQRNLLQHLLFYKSQHATLFKNIYQVKPGHFLISSSGTAVQNRYWDLDYPLLADTEAKSIDKHAATSELRDLIKESVDLRLIADVPLGCYLSGGLDSSSVLGVASKASTHPLTAVTISFDDFAYDESSIARETAALNGADFRPLNVGALDFAKNLRKAVWHGESLAMNANAVARLLQSRVTREAGFKTVLSGDGADEVFYGYGQFKVDHALHGHRTGFGTFDAEGMNIIKDLNKRTATNGLPVTSYIENSLGFTPVWLWQVLGIRSVIGTELLADELLNEVSEDDVMEEFMGQFSVYDQLRGRHPVHQSMYLLMKSVLCNQVLYADRLDMAHSIEVRMPMLDHKLFEYTKTVPVDWMFEQGREKVFLREAMKPYLTSNVYDQVKMPFFAPPATTERDGEMFSFARDIFSSTAFKNMGFFDSSKINNMLGRLSSMGDREARSMDDSLMLMLTSYFLVDSFNASVT